LAAVRSTGTGFQTLSPHRTCCRRISSTATRRAGPYSSLQERDSRLAPTVSTQQTLRSDLEISTLSIPRSLARSVPRGSSAPWIATSRKHFSLYLELHNRQRARGSAPYSPM